VGDLEKEFPAKAQSRKEGSDFHLGFLGVFAPLREILNSNGPTTKPKICDRLLYAHKQLTY